MPFFFVFLYKWLFISFSICTSVCIFINTFSCTLLVLYIYWIKCTVIYSQRILCHPTLFFTSMEAWQMTLRLHYFGHSHVTSVILNLISIYKNIFNMFWIFYSEYKQLKKRVKSDVTIWFTNICLCGLTRYTTYRWVWHLSPVQPGSGSLFAKHCD